MDLLICKCPGYTASYFQKDCILSANGPDGGIYLCKERQENNRYYVHVIKECGKISYKEWFPYDIQAYDYFLKELRSKAKEFQPKVPSPVVKNHQTIQPQKKLATEREQKILRIIGLVLLIAGTISIPLATILEIHALMGLSGLCGLVGVILTARSFFHQKYKNQNQ